LFENGIGGVVHGFDLPPPLLQLFGFLEVSVTLIDMSVGSKNFSLLHHVFDIGIEGDDAIEYFLGSISGEGGFSFDDREVLFDFLIDIGESFFDPIYLWLEMY
jgi:hypothetical protein